MNSKLLELYRSCRPKEALASQDQYNSANALLGSEVEKFAELIVQECAEFCENKNSKLLGTMLKEHFGVEE